MPASFPASMVNQKRPDLGGPNRFSLSSSRFRRTAPSRSPDLIYGRHREPNNWRTRLLNFRPSWSRRRRGSRDLKNLLLGPNHKF
jgi:hypothetical protein